MGKYFGDASEGVSDSMQDTVTVKDALKFIQGLLLPGFIGLLVGGAVGYVVSKQSPDRYSANALLEVKDLLDTDGGVSGRPGSVLLVSPGELREFLEFRHLNRPNPANGDATVVSVALAKLSANMIQLTVVGSSLEQAKSQIKAVVDDAVEHYRDQTEKVLGYFQSRLQLTHYQIDAVKRSVAQLEKTSQSSGSAEAISHVESMKRVYMFEIERLKNEESRLSMAIGQMAQKNGSIGSIIQLVDLKPTSEAPIGPNRKMPVFVGAFIAAFLTMFAVWLKRNLSTR
jgi:hypothetical protein